MKFNTFILTFLLLGVFSVAQLSDYNYKRTLEPITNDWHSISLPDAVFGKLNPDLTDIRIYGITASNDTITAPYILRINEEKLTQEKHSFKIINTSKTSNGHYLTFKTEDLTTINSIHLTFADTNFDWKLNLEASQNQTEWFQILEDYRILSIKNTSTDYSFTQLLFPDAQYQYYRILIKSDEKPQLDKAQIALQNREVGQYKNHSVKHTNIVQLSSKKSTSITFELEHILPVHFFKINVNADYDYYRPLRFEYLVDSVNTEKGWVYNYKSIDSDYLSSFEDNEFNFSGTIAQKFRVTVYNGDNRPLNIESITAKGYQYELLARFNEPANYVLAYGNAQAHQANYDIAKFKDNIPPNLSYLKLGDEIIIANKQSKSNKPLFESELWLWVIMGIIILLLGGFTIKMLQKTQ